jgi:LysM repeat protein
MKSIGIKLADGSFYPVLEEGQPAKKTLDLTTAHDNQTTVMVDLYRSDTGTMEDAEYVDTLQIDNLAAHPNGEPDLSFDISLDENNKLSAEINDPESGRHSDTTITLVSRTLEERMNQSDFSLAPSESSDGQPGEPVRDAAEAVGAGAAAGGLLAAAAKKRDEDDGKAEPENEVPADDDLVPESPDFSDLDLPDDLDLTESPVQNDESEEAEEKAAPEKVPEAENMTQDFTEPDVHDTADGYEDTLSFAKDALDTEPDKASSADAEDSAAAESDSFNAVVDDLPDFNEPEKPAQNAAETVKDADETVAESNFDMPDFGPADTESAETENSDAASSPEDFSLPDFDEIDSSKPDATDKNALDDFFNDTAAPNDASQYVKDNTPSNGINFDGLYDKETEEGNSATKNNTETSIRKKTKTPVLICVICALICVVATLLILFVIPSKYNLITMHSGQSVRTEAGEIQEPAVQPEEPEPQPEETTAPAPAAREDEVVVAPAAETVAPEKPAAPAKKPADIVYHIKWGDTLWDIADAYYKNPWRYHRIARYNHIKDPDYIISGTTIKLPAE